MLLQHASLIGPIFVALIVLASVALLILGAVLMTRTIVHRPSVAGSAAPSGSSGPLLILEERFARGEIDEDEFRRKRDTLRS